MVGRDRPFVGRKRELALLQQALEDARAGHRAIVTIAGEPGIGKTRLVAEFSAGLESSNVCAFQGRCDVDGSIPYQALVEALREYVSREGGELGVELAGASPELGRLFPDVAGGLTEAAGTMSRSVESQRYALFDSVAALMARLAQDQPLVLILEDLHWSAQPLLALIRHLFRSPRLRRLLIVVTYRETDLGDGHPLSGLLADVGHEEYSSRLALSGLSDDEVAELFDAAGPAVQEVPDREKLLRSVSQRTDGNPFFVLAGC